MVIKVIGHFNLVYRIRDLTLQSFNDINLIFITFC